MYFYTFRQDYIMLLEVLSISSHLMRIKSLKYYYEANFFK